jgi:hypothetical protein
MSVSYKVASASLTRSSLAFAGAANSDVTETVRIGSGGRSGLPEYRLEFVEGDVVRLRARARARLEDGAGEGPLLDAGVYDRVRAAAPGYDPYWLEAEWLRHWRASGRPPLRRPEAAFVAFARSRATRSPQR